MSYYKDSSDDLDFKVKYLSRKAELLEQALKDSEAVADIRIAVDKEFDCLPPECEDRGTLVSCPLCGGDMWIPNDMEFGIIPGMNGTRTLFSKDHWECPCCAADYDLIVEQTPTPETAGMRLVEYTSKQIMRTLVTDTSKEGWIREFPVEHIE